MLLETASALLRLRPSEDVRVVLTVATGPRSEVKIIRTAAGERFVAKHYVGDDARRRFVAETSVLRMLSEHSRAPVPRLEAVSPDELVIVMREAEGISVEVVDPRTLVPMDAETIRASVRKTGRLVVVDEAPATCSAASEIVALVTEDPATFRALKAPAQRVCAAPVQKLPPSGSR